MFFIKDLWFWTMDTSISSRILCLCNWQHIEKTERPLAGREGLQKNSEMYWIKYTSLFQISFKLCPTKFRVCGLSSYISRKLKIIFVLWNTYGFLKGLFSRLGRIYLKSSIKAQIASSVPLQTFVWYHVWSDKEWLIYANQKFADHCRQTFGRLLTDRLS